MPLLITPPWRSVLLPRVAVAVALTASLPLYLRSSLWCDITLYDMAVRNLLDGGIHYRDLFDTNLPGFVWLLTGLRWVFGPSAIVVRLADLAIVLAAVSLIDLLAKWGGATRASRWWALAGAAFLYPFALEMVHAQRDMWMALPALAAVVLRIDRTRKGDAADAESTVPEAYPAILSRAALEGTLWGLAVWIKPHIVLMAGAVWLLSIRRLIANQPRPGRAVLADLFGNFAGGLAVGTCGVAWLIESGTWPHFWNVISLWNPEYAKLGWQELGDRATNELHWFAPWSLWLIPSVPLAMLSIVDAAPWSSDSAANPKLPGPVGRTLPAWLWDREADRDARFARAILAGLYLVWAAQAFLIQRAFLYAHMPETLLMLGLWASHRWAMPLIPLLWLAATSSVWLLADYNPSFDAQLRTIATCKAGDALVEEHYIVRHPLADPRWMRCWSHCWSCDLSESEQFALWDCLRRVREHEASIDWSELAEVAAFLRTQSVQDREVIAWHDSPHAIYLLLGIKPGLRFMHTSTAQTIGDFGSYQVRKELREMEGTARFAIGDLAWAIEGTNVDGELTFGPPRSTSDLLPVDLYRRGFEELFPFNQRTVFRSRSGLGRYTVHRLKPPFEDGPRR